MLVSFCRTGERRYAVVIDVPGREAQTMNPAPGFDVSIPHDLVHYVVEAELGLSAGVYGRAAAGGGTFYAAAEPVDARARARARRKQARRERTLDRDDERDEQLKTSERLAALCDLAWRRRHGQRPAPGLSPVTAPISEDDRARVARVVARLDRLAPLWEQLPIDGRLSFEWPRLEPSSP